MEGIFITYAISTVVIQLYMLLVMISFMIKGKLNNPYAVLDYFILSYIPIVGVLIMFGELRADLTTNDYKDNFFFQASSYK